MKKKIKKKREGLESQSGDKKRKKRIIKKNAGTTKKEKIFTSADGKLKQRFVPA